MKIINVESQPVSACAQFKFQGWTVSMSTIFKGTSICAWNDQNGDEIEGRTVESVLNQIIMRGLGAVDKTTFVGRS